MRIGVNLLFWEPRSGGLGRYARELLANMVKLDPELRVTAFHGLDLPGDVRESPWAPGIEWVELPTSVTSGTAKSGIQSLAAQWGAIAWMAERRRLHVIHGLANVAPLVTARAATVVTSPDLIWMRFGRSMSPRDTLAMKVSAIPSVKRATRVIAISESVKADLQATLGVDGDRIDVVPLGVRADSPTPPADEAALRDRLGLGDRRLVLCVAQKREHKNLTGLVRAMARLPERDVALVIPGGSTGYEAEVRRVGEAVGFGDRLAMPDWVSEEDLEGLYKVATAFVLPSFEEGFGLPVLEAMARGVPVACSNTTALPEVAGDAAELFDPRDPDDIARAVGALVRDASHRAQLVERGRRQVERFGWEATGRRTLETYRRAVSDKRARR